MFLMVNISLPFECCLFSSKISVYVNIFQNDVYTFLKHELIIIYCVCIFTYKHYLLRILQILVRNNQLNNVNYLYFALTSIYFMETIVDCQVSELT